MTEILLSDALLAMSQHGQSVKLGWGEDTHAWDCAWVTSGRRYAASHHSPSRAVLEVMDQTGFHYDKRHGWVFAKELSR